MNCHPADLVVVVRNIFGIPRIGADCGHVFKVVKSDFSAVVGVVHLREGLCPHCRDERWYSDVDLQPIRGPGKASPAPPQREPVEGVTS